MVGAFGSETEVPKIIQNHLANATPWLISRVVLDEKDDEIPALGPSNGRRGGTRL